MEVLKDCEHIKAEKQLELIKVHIELDTDKLYSRLYFFLT